MLRLSHAGELTHELFHPRGLRGVRVQTGDFPEESRSLVPPVFGQCDPGEGQMRVSGRTGIQFDDTLEKSLCFIELAERVVAESDLVHDERIVGMQSQCAHLGLKGPARVAGHQQRTPRFSQPTYMAGAISVTRSKSWVARP